MAIKLKDMKQLKEELRDLPPNNSEEREISTQEAVSMMAEEVALLRQKGYSLEQISELLTRGGLQISASTLKRYLYKAGKGTIQSRKGSPVKTRRKTSKEDTSQQSGVHEKGTSKSGVENVPVVPVRNGKNPNDPSQNQQQNEGNESDRTSKSTFSPRPDSDSI